MTRHRTTARAPRRAFTIIEVMIVLVIIGLIGGIVTLNLVGTAAEAKVQTTKASMNTVVQALKMYQTTNNKYPETATWQQDIRNTLSSPPDDAWGRPLAYFQMEDGRAFLLISDGEDGIPDTADDIRMEPDHE